MRWIYVCLKVVGDVCIILILIFGVLTFNSYLVPTKHGFFCSDLTIRYPYVESTVSNNALLVLTTVPPVVTILSVEVFWNAISDEIDQERVEVGKRTIPGIVVRLYKSLGYYLFGLEATALITSAGKYVVGRLRPHFLNVCKVADMESGDKKNVDCADIANRLTYVTRYKCQNPKEHSVVTARKSFPSGHSSLSAYSMLYVAIYLHFRLTWRYALLLKHLLQTLCIIVSWLVALSRIKDRHHHKEDVIVGMVIGYVIAALTIFYVADLGNVYFDEGISYPASNISGPSKPRTMAIKDGSEGNA